MKKERTLLIITLLLLISLTCIFNVFAHKGKTDASGGHRDNNNQSESWGYHYHCGGYPAHLHTNGDCPYTSYSSSGSSSILESARKAATVYDDGYDDGYENGYNDGYEEGYNKRILLLTVVIMGTIFLIVVFVINLIRYLTRRRRKKRGW